MYKIISTEVSEETINTDVEFTFTDGEQELVRISHFMPESTEVVLQNILNREISEQTKRDAEKKNKLIAKQLEIIINEE